MTFRYNLNSAILDQMVGNDVKRDAWLGSVAQQMAGNMQLSMTESPATGKQYSRGKKTHIASSPGHPPRVDLGILRASIKPKKISLKKWAIQTDVLHGKETEFGIGMAPRPWMRPEFVKAATWITRWAKGGKLV